MFQARIAYVIPYADTGRYRVHKWSFEDNYPELVIIDTHHEGYRKFQYDAQLNGQSLTEIEVDIDGTEPFVNRLNGSQLCIAVQFGIANKLVDPQEVLMGIAEFFPFHKEEAKKISRNIKKQKGGVTPAETPREPSNFPPTEDINSVGNALIQMSSKEYLESVPPEVAKNYFETMSRLAELEGRRTINE